jgi:hypothetical protein
LRSPGESHAENRFAHGRLICAAEDGKRCATTCEVMDTDFSRVPFYTW